MGWIKNSKGKRDAMLTFATIGFSVVTLNILLHMFSPICDKNFEMMDESILTIYIGATFSSYVVRRMSDKKDSNEKEGANE